MPSVPRREHCWFFVVQFQMDFCPLMRRFADSSRVTASPPLRLYVADLPLFGAPASTRRQLSATLRAQPNGLRRLTWALGALGGIRTRNLLIRRGISGVPRRPRRCRLVTL